MYKKSRVPTLIIVTFAVALSVMASSVFEAVAIPEAPTQQSSPAPSSHPPPSDKGTKGPAETTDDGHWRPQGPVQDTMIAFHLDPGHNHRLIYQALRQQANSSSNQSFGTDRQ